MNINISVQGSYQVLLVEEEMTVISDLSELRYIIEGYLKEGRNCIAVSFAGTSYIYSGAIAVLIDCFKKIKQEGGDLCIIESNAQVMTILRILNIHKVISIYPTVNDIPTSLTE